MERVWFGSQLRVEAVGRENPAGETVRKDEAVPPVIVMFAATALTPAAGIPAVLSIPRALVSPWPIAPPETRVSRTRTGDIGWYPPDGSQVKARETLPAAAPFPATAIRYLSPASAVKETALDVPPEILSDEATSARALTVSPV